MDYASLYKQDYYDSHYDGTGYKNAQAHLQKIADEIYEKAKPETVLEIGCAYGFIVARMRDLGVSAYGIDISEFAVSQVPESAKPYVRARSVLDGLPDDFPKKYDLVVTFECLEHMVEEDGKKVVEFIASITDEVIFSAAPGGPDDKTHFNVQPPEYWVAEFAKYGFKCYGSVGLTQPPWWSQRVKRAGDDETSKINAQESAAIKLKIIETLYDAQKKDELITKSRAMLEKAAAELERLNSDYGEMSKKYNEMLKKNL